MGCNERNDATPLSSTASRDGGVGGTPYNPDDRFLVVSDEIETVSEIPFISTVGSPSKTRTLYKCIIPLGSGQHKFRVFLWHLHDAPDVSTMYFKLLASLSVGTGTANDIVWEADATNDLIKMGKCIAKSQLYTLYDGPHSTEDLSTTEKVLFASHCTRKQVVGAVVEFTVQLDQACDLHLRTTANDTTAIPGSFGNAMSQMNPDSTKRHVRGWWTKSSVTLSLGTFDATPLVGVGHQQYQLCPQDGKEWTTPEGFQKMSGTGHSEDLSNVGAYGANLYYDLSLTNTGGSNAPVYAFLLAYDHYPNDHSKYLNYYGASYIADPANYQWGVPSLCLVPDGIQAIKLNSPDPVLVPPGGCTMKIGLANGGGSSTPILLYVNKIDAVPPVDPG